MSEKEEKDLLRLMSQCDYAVTHADRFVEDLQKQLNLLDGANIQSIMASEESVLKLMDMLAEAVRHVEMLETRLDGYDEILDQARIRSWTYYCKITTLDCTISYKCRYAY